jgi:imidazolonepropionase-like amidohydrolase
MMLLSLALGALAAPAPDLVALRVGRAETVSQGTIPHAVILIEDGKIVTIGQDLPIERGIPVVDLPDVVVTPGFVNCRSRMGLDSRAGNGATPQIRALDEFVPSSGPFREALANGVTTIGLYPAGGGIPGQAGAIRTAGSGLDGLVLEDSVYLAMYVGADKSKKKQVRDAFESVDKYMEKLEKEREKYEEAVEKAKKKKKSKDDDEEDSEKEELPDEFVPPAPDPEVIPMLRLLNGELRALVGIGKAADFLHALDAFEDREFEYDLQIDMRDELDLFLIADRIAEHDLRVVTDPVITLHPGTRRERNLPGELAAAGCKLALVPRSDSGAGHERWRREVSELVRYGLPVETALRAMTHEPAAVMGLEDRVGSLAAGLDANLIFFDGEPFAEATRILGVMLEGQIVSGDLRL